MTSKKQTKGKKNTQIKSMVLDISKLYDVKEEDITLNMKEVYYSNLAYIQVSQRDVYIDFLEMPGLKADDKMKVNGIRIFMSHVSAKRLANALKDILDNVYKKGEMELYSTEK